MRGVTIGNGCFIGTDVVIETAFPFLVKVGHGSVIGLRTTIVAHFDGDVAANGVPRQPTVVIGENVFIGPATVIMPNVRIGAGSVVAAGSVVTRSVPPRRMVQGNPARVVGTCAHPLTPHTSTWRFLQGITSESSPKTEDKE
jgi:maltose O-acetyltransferase